MNNEKLSVSDSSNDKVTLYPVSGREVSMKDEPVSWPCAAEFYSGVDDPNKKLGQGAFSTVYRGLCKQNNFEIAIKVMDLENVSSSFEDILLEVQTMRLSNHENILKLHASFVCGTKLWLVLEYMDKGSCFRVMSVAKKQGLGEGMNEDWVAYIIRETLKGLNYLHNAGYIHRDIKPGNILLNKYGAVRLADFGVTGWILSHGQRHDNVRTFVGTLCYMSPEIMEQTSGYDQKADIWSLGITALELAKGYAPYAKYAPMKVLVMTIEEEPPSLKSYKDDLQRNGAPFSKVFEDFCCKCLKRDSRLRSSAEELLHHKFISKVKSKESLVEQLLNHIPAIDSNVIKDSQDSVASSSGCRSDEVPDDFLKNSNSSVSHDSKYVAGTTWIFDDESTQSNRSSIYRRSMINPLEKSTSSHGNIINISSLNQSSSGQMIYRISKQPESVASPGDIDEFLDDFEIDSATIKTAKADTQKSKVLDGNTDTSTFMDEISDIIGENGTI